MVRLLPRRPAPGPSRAPAALASAYTHLKQARTPGTHGGRPTQILSPSRIGGCYVGKPEALLPFQRQK